MHAHEVDPLLGHGDGLLLEVRGVNCVPLVVGVSQDSRDLILEHAVHNVPEVFLVALPAFVQLGRQVGLDLLPSGEVVVHGLDGDLGVVADVHRLDLRLLEQHLLAGQDHPDPLLGQALQGRSVVLGNKKGQRL